MSTLTRRARRAVRWTSARVGLRTTHRTGERLTVLMAVYHASRLPDVDVTIRTILRCEFVDRVVVSVNNPDLPLDQCLRVRSARLEVHRDGHRHGCGHRWHLARELEFAYLLVLDDDLLLTTRQVHRLFSALVDDPTVPHGLSGMRRTAAGLEFVDRCDGEVDHLCEAYAVTPGHVRRYHEIERDLSASPEVTDAVEAMADFAVISRTGAGKPRIHDFGHLLRGETFKTPGVAIHRDETFTPRLTAVARALARIPPSAFVVPR